MKDVLIIKVRCMQYPRINSVNMMLLKLFPQPKPIYSLIYVRTKIVIGISMAKKGNSFFF